MRQEKTNSNFDKNIMKRNSIFIAMKSGVNLTMAKQATASVDEKNKNTQGI